ncbi:ABC transporter ATP-binding protein [Cnuibacter physcomitrellae]|uniref:ABC transporter ATP-binding protein n=1 Tax=Cnuibacter physcomitrellae TaxID=1619308 RepID=A0A1X9LR60_9MICO|nr:ABC transporter ATP-binding protein [Cnuibacter physcomitrellae]ARJ06808.1 ABC transporter ATP-binding protein [Cnuibacter physcomitrellae]GGI38886.1 ABC transporter ATP-binding protein [Cnuibacter physcomitrellae]
MTALLEVTDLVVDFPTSSDEVFHAVDSVSFTVHAGERVGIVGESGSGKSLTSQAIMRLIPSPGEITSGSVRFQGEDVLAYSTSKLRSWRGSQTAMVFQDPMSSLNPLMRIGRQITETLQEHLGMSKAESRARAIELLQQVGIPDAEARLRDYPGAFSGGMRQRVCIAIATACSPRLLIADEPTTALDVTVQAQVLDLLDTLATESDTGVILISHDLGVISSFCDRILVMYAGRIVEQGTAEQIVGDPQHPYTKALLESILKLDQPVPHRLSSISGTPPVAGRRPSGCSFAPRCALAVDACSAIDPALVPTTNGSAGQLVACGVTAPAAFAAGEEVTAA